MELYRDKEFVELLDSIRLHAGSVRSAQKKYFRTRSQIDLQVSINCEKHLDALLDQAAKIVVNSNQLKIF